jgi:hypothetical protein
MNSNDARRSARRSDPATGGILRIKTLRVGFRDGPQSEATLCSKKAFLCLKKALANAPGSRGSRRLCRRAGLAVSASDGRTDTGFKLSLFRF